ncbi:4Fe-4S binding protein [Halopiger djelfimassiliensis]|uniref:4Fe-4S binding protein n=1 Tax=Halopiger djelfimassiliensis TaxID=1293047 RepID=UPI000677A668|nr:4Fe-4S binding protein [Halopiger djelfimassiliensis]
MTADQSPDRSISITNNRIVRFLFTSKRVQHAVNLVTVAVFFYAIYRAAVGPTDPSRNFGSVAFFGFWWAPIMILSLLFFGRIWCYFCPLGAIVRFTQRFGLRRHFPMYTQSKRTVFGLQLSILSLTAVTFILARWGMADLGVSYSPGRVPYYWLAIVGVAVAVSLVYQRQAFCRYVCPATGVMSVTAKFSPLEVAQNRETGVTCATLEYKSDYLSTDRRCTACMKCTSQQPDEDVELRFRWPGAKAVTERIPLVDEAIIALVIWGSIPINFVLGSAILTALSGRFPSLLVSTTAYLASVIAALVAFAAANKLASAWSGVDWEPSFTKFGLSYAPLGLMWALGDFVIAGLLENGGHTVNVLAQGLGIPLSLPAGASPSVVSAWVSVFVTGWLWLAVLWSGAIAWQVATVLTDSKRRALKAFAPHFALMTTSTFGLVVGVVTGVSYPIA